MLDTKEENSELILEEFFKFLKENKKYPSKCDSDSEQNRLYDWYENIKLSNPEFLKRIRKFARKDYIFLKYSPSKSNKDRKEQLENFVKINNRLPKKSSKNNEEKSLANWYLLQVKLNRINPKEYENN